MIRHFVGACKIRLPVQHFYYAFSAEFLVFAILLMGNKVTTIFAKILILLIFSSIANAGQIYSYQERLIFCMVPLEHADAEQLAEVLVPFLSPQGKITAYSPTNTLIIKDQPPVVKMLIKVIKGKADLSECQNFQNGSEGNKNIKLD
jgi:type II secretory pathway component GspD/PulD (secretin)